jgi:hypothetical protein
MKNRLSEGDNQRWKLNLPSARRFRYCPPRNSRELHDDNHELAFIPIPE